jgi:hypothetical protein
MKSMTKKASEAKSLIPVLPLLLTQTSFSKQDLNSAGYREDQMMRIEQ